MIELGFVHGRFQLFHNDHLTYVLEAKKQCKKIIVGVTSPENALLIREEIDPHRSNSTGCTLVPTAASDSELQKLPITRVSTVL